MTVPNWIWYLFVFANGCCIGSFLNVVVYRMPRDKSLMSPPSSCPACNRRIRFYDNIPLVSWLLLGRKCRFCKAPVSPRYFVIELLTGLVFLGVCILYFSTDLRKGVPPFLEGGWLFYLLHIVLLSAFIAASAIDLELWIIPLGICWFVTIAAFIISAFGGYLIEPTVIAEYSLFPRASFFTGSLAIGASVGLAISSVLLMTGLLKRSYEEQGPDQAGGKHQNNTTENDASAEPDVPPEGDFNHRLEACREIVYLLPIIICSVAAYLILSELMPSGMRVSFDTKHPVFAGLLGSIWGYFVGCGIVWAIRVFGAFAFGKEAMGLGDVHLMGAAGAVIGPIMVVIAFFVAPFFGLAWAGSQMFFKKVRQIPYGPFLSLGVFVVIIFHDAIMSRIDYLF
ncbi:MAG: prepilin peptidase [Phycisphaerales bacterium]|nr:MAG: prepilin peptidase [Phycisphaerales bacterium]